MTRSPRALRATLLLFAGLTGAAIAQDGGQLFATYCSACHAPDGKGATGGQFPPLAGSPWVAGEADRAIKVVLHGLQGPVEVAGKNYDLVMPPQGGALPDDQIAAILTHVRSSWGNNAGKVTTEQVKAIRDSLPDRTEMWTQEELLNLHPFPKKEPALKNLISRIYHGEWKKLPDFENLEPVSVEEEHDGIISLKQADKKNLFGMVWEADFIAPKKGKYVFRFACDDGGRIVFDDEVMLEVHGTGPMSGDRTQAAALDLDAGAHPIRVEYYEFMGQEGISISWKGPGKSDWQELTDTNAGKPSNTEPSIPIQATPERAAIYRNFIAGTTPRAIGIGLPGGVNFAYSADHLAPELLWTGKFMDGGRHWTNRGQGAEPPAGDRLIKPTDKPAFPENANFRGYQLDPQGNPTFTVQIAELTVKDQYKASDGKLVRDLSATGKGDPIEILISDLLPVTPGANGEYQLGPQMNLSTTNAEVVLRDGNAFLKLAPGTSTTLTYSWK
jgi:mono/diheme cytochrome c family protein